MTDSLDMRGRACPEPVVETRKALAQAGTDSLEVLVDNDSSAENVKRMAESLGCRVSVEKRKEDEYAVLIDRGPTGEECQVCTPPARVVMLVASSTFGEGSIDLGATLMGSLMKIVKDLSPRPECLIFLNSGVHLTTEGSDVLGFLKELEADGVQILSCGTCLNYFKCTEKLKVGSISNMLEIGNLLVSADRVIRI